MSFYVYTHARPDGSVFYVGKGAGRRAWDMSPSRRSEWHNNVVRKHGRKNIIVQTYPAASEQDAFAMEAKMITSLDGLVNLTKGGEGCSGRAVTESQAAGLTKGRGPLRRLTEESRAAILEGLSRGRETARIWRDSPEGRAHIKSLGQRSAAATAMRCLQMTCCACRAAFTAKSPKAKYCSWKCNQRVLRARRNRVPEEVSGAIHTGPL